MTRHTMTSLLAAATFTVACGGSPATTDEETVAPAVSTEGTQAPAAAPEAVVPEPAPPQSSAADRPEALPDTASPLPLLGLGGVLALAGAAGIRAVRRR